MQLSSHLVTAQISLANTKNASQHQVYIGCGGRWSGYRHQRCYHWKVYTPTLVLWSHYLVCMKSFTNIIDIKTRRSQYVVLMHPCYTLEFFIDYHHIFGFLQIFLVLGSLKNDLFQAINLFFGFCVNPFLKLPQSFVRHNYVKYWDF